MGLCLSPDPERHPVTEHHRRNPDAVPDLEAAARYLRERPDVDGGRVGGLGLSVGGELMLEAAATSADLRAVVSEGAGVRSHREQLDMPDAGRWTTLPFWAITSVATSVFGNAPVPAALTALTPRIAPRPMFLIWATNGNAEELNVSYFDAAGPPKESRPMRSQTRSAASKPSALIASQRAAVRRHCQTMALCTGSPVRRSQMTVVSRWLVMPIAATSDGVTRACSSTARAVSRWERQMSCGSCSTHPGLGKCWGNSCWATETGLPASLKRMARELVVP